MYPGIFVLCIFSLVILHSCNRSKAGLIILSFRDSINRIICALLFRIPKQLRDNKWRSVSVSSFICIALFSQVVVSADVESLDCFEFLVLSVLSSSFLFGTCFGSGSFTSGISVAILIGFVIPFINKYLLSLGISYSIGFG